MLKVINTEEEWELVRERIRNRSDGSDYSIPRDTSGLWALVNTDTRGVLAGISVAGMFWAKYLLGDEADVKALLKAGSRHLQAQGFGSARILGQFPDSAALRQTVETYGLAQRVTRAQAVARGMGGEWDAVQGTGQSLWWTTIDQLVTATAGF
ncbi:MAG TPA: hypothetical protein VGA24_07175 [Steroidobacteraceae bacterium]